MFQQTTLKPGAHIAVQADSGFGKHHMLLLIINRQKWLLHFTNDGIQIDKYSSYMDEKRYDVISRERNVQAVRRGIDSCKNPMEVNGKRFDLLRNNCEHAVTYWSTGQSHSYQIALARQEILTQPVWTGMSLLSISSCKKNVKRGQEDEYEEEEEGNMVDSLAPSSLLHATINEDGSLTIDQNLLVRNYGIAVGSIVRGDVGSVGSVVLSSSELSNISPGLLLGAGSGYAATTLTASVAGAGAAAVAAPAVVLGTVVGSLATMVTNDSECGTSTGLGCGVGMATGATVGSVVPIVGTAIGAGVGALIGTVAGYMKS